MGALKAWVLGPHPVFSLWASRARPLVGAAGCLSKGSNARVPDVHCADSPGTLGRLPSGAYPEALHPPCAMTRPHPDAVAGGGRGIHADVNATPLLRDHPNIGAGPEQARVGAPGEVGFSFAGGRGNRALRPDPPKTVLI